MAATLEELEARVSALEARDVDYRSVLKAVNALGANQREQAHDIRGLKTDMRDVKSRLNTVESKLDDTNGRVRSLEDGQAEIKELLVRALDKQ